MGVPRWFILLAGPNGAGKSTFASRFLPSLFEDVPFINVDELARAMVPTAPNPDFAAGREAIRRIESFIDQKRNLIVETTLSGRGHLNRLDRLRSAGWRTAMIYLSLRSPEDALLRIAQRVLAGGHDVPANIVRRRFRRSLDNVAEFARRVDVTIVLDNSEESPRLIAIGHKGHVELLDRERHPELTSRLAQLSRGSVPE